MALFKKRRKKRFFYVFRVVKLKISGSRGLPARSDTTAGQFHIMIGDGLAAMYGIYVDYKKIIIYFK